MIIVIDTDKMRKEGYKMAEIKNLRTRCGATTTAAKELRYHIPVGEVEKLLGTSTMHLSNASKKKLFPPREGMPYNRYYDVQEIIRYLWQSVHGYNVELRIKRQKEMELIIKNRKALGQLIDVAEAEDRSVNFLSAIKRMFIYITKTSSALLVGCSSPRIAEKILLDQFNDVFKTLEAQAKKVEWTDEKKAKLKEIEAETSEEFNYSDENS